MGGWDSYCAICGSTFRSRLSIDSDDETDLTYSGEVIGESDLQWLQTLRAIGLNAESPEKKKSFITGPGIYDDHGSIVVTAGEDPNIPLDERGKMPWLCAYYDPTQEGNQIVFPFHEVCYKDILLRCFKYEKIDTDIFHALCQDKREDFWNQLTLDYGNPNPSCEQYWECRKGEEVLVTHPVEIPQLITCLGIIQEILASEEKALKSWTVQHNHDIFDKLPDELRQEVFNLLPISSVLALKAASSAMHVCPDRFWKQKLQTEIPWLWELHDIDPFKSQALEACLSKIVAELERKSRYKEGKVDYIPGLVNRRRIWTVCEEIRRLYQEKLEGVTS